MRWVAKLGGVVGGMLLAGCVSVGTIESYWVIHAKGDSTVTIRALERSAVALGGKQLGEAGPTGATYTFGNETLSFRVNDESIVAYGGSVAIGRRATERGKQSLSNLVEGVVGMASRDSHVPMQLSPGSEQEPPLAIRPGAQSAATNSQLKEYAPYLRRVMDAIDKQWNAVLANTNTYPPPGSWVSFTFVLAPDGRITQIKNVDSHTTPNGEKLALAGLTGHSPFDPWTSDMKAKLNPAGEELVFTFYYE